MKLAHKQLILAAMIGALGLAASAQTPPPPPAGAPGPGMMHRDGPGRMDSERMRARMQERMAHRMAKLKQLLQITPAQEGAWNAYVAALRPANMQRPDRRKMRDEFEKMTTPERIDRMRAMRAARMAEMDKRADATKVFYAALTPEQKKSFDLIGARMFKGRGHRGHGGGHRM